MAFVAEDGTGRADANSYAAVAFVDGYHSDRGNAAWAAASNNAKQSALILATDFIDRGYRFRGFKLLPATQALQWPRVNVITRDGLTVLPSNSVPALVLKAVAELALAALSLDLEPNVGGAQSKQIVSQIKKAGPLWNQSEFSQQTGEGPLFRKARGYMLDLLAPIGLMRA